MKIVRKCFTLAWTWPEIKKTLGCYYKRQFTKRRDELCFVYCVLLQGDKRDCKNQNSCNSPLSGLVIISEFPYCCEGDQQLEEIFRKSETRKLLLSFHSRPLTDFALKKTNAANCHSSRKKNPCYISNRVSEETVTL